jgi:SAM-dependent methyltransferase
MSIEDRQRWEEKHRRGGALTARESVLALPRASSPDALALDLACGRGRHSLALEHAGYRVVAMDASRQGLLRIRESCEETRGARIHAVLADTDAWPFAAQAFDLIVQVDFLDRSLFPQMKASLGHAGLLLIDTFLNQGRPNAEGPSRPMFLLAPGELRAAFSDFDVLHYGETAGESARGCLLARKL